MLQGGNETQSGTQIGDDLESYRRLVELQKQMIQLAQQHKQSKRECEALRTQVVREISARMRERPGLNQRLRTAAFRMNLFNRGESSPC